MTSDCYNFVFTGSCFFRCLRVFQRYYTLILILHQILILSQFPVFKCCCPCSRSQLIRLWCPQLLLLHVIVLPFTSGHNLTFRNIRCSCIAQHFLVFSISLKSTFDVLQFRSWEVSCSTNSVINGLLVLKQWTVLRLLYFLFFCNFSLRDCVSVSVRLVLL